MGEKIKQILSGLPEAPGVYCMRNAEGRIVYIGKSKCLKKRVNSYFVKNPKWDKAQKMVPFIEDIDYIVTDTHLDARLLECALIKQIRPFFNVCMKNDQKYMFLKIGENFRRPAMKLTARREADSFGPLRGRGPGERAVLSMRNLYPLERKRGGYGFQYHVLPQEMGREDYEKNREILLEICGNTGAAQRFLKCLERAMKTAAARQRYEEAARYRDLIQDWTYLKRELNAYEDFLTKDAVYAAPFSKGYKYFYIRDGLVIHTGKGKDQSREAVCDYAARMAREQVWPPKEAYLSLPMTEKGKVDFRAIVYGHIGEAEEGAALYLL